MANLPTSWTSVTIGTVVDVNPGKLTNLEQDDVVTFVPMAAVDEISGTITARQTRSLQEVNKGFTQFQDGDVLFAKITPSMENGKSAVADTLENGIGFGSTEFHVMRSNGAVHPDYLWRFIRQRAFRNNAQKVMSGAVGQQRVPAEYLRNHVLPLPPIEEQQRIVTKIDQLLLATERARRSLDEIPALIDRYKSRVLELACSGRLTSRWRSSRKLDMPRVVVLADVAEGFNYGTSSKSAQEGDFPVLRMGNIQAGRLDWTNLVYSSDPREFEKYRLEDGDVLFNRTNSPELVGKTAVFRGVQDAIFAGYLIRVQCGPLLLPEYISYCLNSPQGRQYSWDVKSDGVSQSNINAKKLARFEFLLPSIEEQTEIVRLVDSAISSVDHANSESRKSISYLADLEAHILSKAFNGTLLAQHSNDEPAEQLLARVAGERHVATSALRDRKTSQRMKQKGKKNSPMTDLVDVLKTKADWMSTRDAATQLGIGNGSTSDALEEFYSNLRIYVIAGDIEVERRGEEDWLRLNEVRAL